MYESCICFTSLLTVVMVSLVLILDLLIDVHLVVVLNSISLMIDDVDHRFMCLFAIHISSSVKCVFKSLLIFQNSSYILDTSP